MLSGERTMSFSFIAPKASGEGCVLETTDMMLGGRLGRARGVPEKRGEVHVEVIQRQGAR